MSSCGPGGHECVWKWHALCRYDVEAVRMVRRFKGHKDRVTGLVISQDARWLLSSSMDGTVRVWDIPAACCLQVTLNP